MWRPSLLALMLASSSSLACGASTPATERPRAVRPDDFGGELEQTPTPPLDASLPVDAAIVGTIDVAAVVRHPLVAGIVAASLRRIDLVAVLGLDAARPVTFAVSSLPSSTSEIDARVAAIAPTISLSAAAAGNAPPLDPGLYRRVAALWRGIASPWLHARIVVPVTSPDTWFAGVRPLVEELGLSKRRTAPPGMDGVACQDSGAACLGFSHDASSVVIDAIIPAYFTYPEGEAGRAAGDLARAALVELGRIRSARPDPTPTVAPALSGALARASWVPGLVAEMAFASGVARTLDTIALGGVDESDRPMLMAQGLYEASQALVLSVGADGPYFGHVDVSAEGAVEAPTLRMHAAAGPSAPPVAVPVGGPSASVSVDSPFAQVDVANAWLSSLALPGARSTASGYDRALEEAGAASVLVALPQWFAFLARFATRGESRDFAFPPAVDARLERTVSVFDDLASDGATLRAGVLPPGTTEAVAVCVLVEEPAACTRRNRLRVGAVTPLERGFVELERVGDRFVLVGGLDRAQVGTRTVHVAASSPVPVSARIAFAPEVERLVRDLFEVRGPVTWLPRGYDLALAVDAAGWDVVAAPLSAAP